MRHLTFVMTLVAAVAPTSSAYAYCSRGISFDFESQINAEFKYLICLHNEQVESLNQHADLINRQAGYIVDLESKIDDLEWEISKLERRVSDLE